VRRIHCVHEECCNFLVQDLGYGQFDIEVASDQRGQLLGGRKKNNNLFRIGIIMPGEINFTLPKFELPCKEDHL